MTRVSELRLQCPAQPDCIKLLRHALVAFLRALEYSTKAVEDVTTAAGEALANAVEHASGKGAGSESPSIELVARLQADQLLVDIIDRGSFIAGDTPPGRGLGLRIMRAIARDISIDTADGTHVRMTF